MSLDGIDEWDENFLDEAIRVELEALSSRNLPPEPILSPPAPPSADIHPSSRPQADAVEPEPTRIRLESETDPFRPPVSCSWRGARVSGRDAGGGTLSFSPPRELSQRYRENPDSEVDCEVVQPSFFRNGRKRNHSGGGGANRDREVERLKRELSNSSKHLKDLEQECAVLKKERSKKDEQLKCAFSEIEAKEAELHSLRSDQVYHQRVNQDKCARQTPHGFGQRKTKGENGILGPSSLDHHVFQHTDRKVEHLQTAGSADHHILIDNCLNASAGVDEQVHCIPQKVAKLKGSKAVGTQTDNYQQFGYTCQEDEIEDHISKTLLSVWDSPNNIMAEKNMISRLLVSCTEEFCVLFRCMNMTSNKDLDCHADGDLSHMNLHQGAQSAISTTSKLSHLDAIIKKMHNGITQLHNLLEALLDICTLENNFVVQRSLRILHTVLRYLLPYNRSIKRKNVSVGQLSSDNVNEEPRRPDWNHIMDHLERTYSEIKSSELPSIKTNSLDLENLCHDKEKIDSNRFLSSESLVSTLKSMEQIVTRNTEESVRVEALSVMILIIIESNPNGERNKFELITLLDVVSKLLQKEAGLHVQKHALHLFFLLLNTGPNTLMLLTSEGKSGPEAEKGSHSVSLKGVMSLLLKGLSECLTSTGTGNLEIKLRKQVIILLAYVASCGRSGFEFLLKPVGPQDVNFLQLIVQILAFEMDVEIADYTSVQSLSKERTLLLREALILLNRLSSHPMYSRPTLEALTGNKTSSLTIDVVNRLSHRNRVLSEYDNAKMVQLKAETMDLAQLFRSRVFAFLGGQQMS
ncbi:protein SENSITIVE TO UV 2-like isoform X1 [Zingiber officinale]|uniref:protein SENSITIVE TO UV 2-like isoform X1 n=1 Tax=Zingiber officinale TaxID=94328 RepID=UPI001C4C4E57|nr:protein SENSITIVE TO UV 2-like isoform X1 [Zingiber officinale]